MKSGKKNSRVCQHLLGLQVLPAITLVEIIVCNLTSKLQLKGNAYKLLQKDILYYK